MFFESVPSIMYTRVAPTALIAALASSPAMRMMAGWMPVGSFSGVTVALANSVSTQGAASASRNNTLAKDASNLKESLSIQSWLTIGISILSLPPVTLISGSTFAFR